MNDFVSIDLEEGLDRQTTHDALMDVARSLSEGYGAGGIALYDDEVYPGYWTGYDSEGSIKVPVMREWSSYRKADAVEAYAKEHYGNG